MLKTLPKVLYYGLKVCASSIRKSISEEIELSNELARIRYQNKAAQKGKDHLRHMMSLDEAQRILDIKTLGNQIRSR